MFTGAELQAESLLTVSLLYDNNAWSTTLENQLQFL